MDTQGGRFTLTINGQTFSGRGKAEIEPAAVEVKAAANRDGSAYRTVTPVLSTLKLSFDRGVGLVWDETMILQDIDVTFQETDAGWTHLFTGASWNGRPSINTEDGEVTGLEVHSAQYQAIAA